MRLVAEVEAAVLFFCGYTEETCATKLLPHLSRELIFAVDAGGQLFGDFSLC
jgi:hypothetical protein